MNNKSLFAVVVILLIGIFAVLGINSRQTSLASLVNLEPVSDSVNANAEANSMSVQNN